ncbi:hypothetical protein [Blastococcus sp. TF02A-26]|uniref:hypothetical protein n=1 Tax=Blastococcus sp. TF02A-26 TaxID=2250577 RepID=UPI000DE8F658|nr:hypothetical protein [Blastococcus sp. TF02A-26]RBY82689.1 hypothetical protein DQ240_18520 [Blastococcus sp. TF02A-26]
MPGLDALTAGAGQTDQRDARHAVGGLLAVQGPTALDVRTGVLHGPGSTALITGTAKTGPKMSVLIGVHHSVGSRGVANGPYLGPTLDAALEVDVDLAPATGSRIDVVYERQRDTTSGVPTPDAATGPEYGVLKGSSSTGTPTKPDLSTIVGATELGTVTVAAGATSTNGSNVTIANTARQTVARGARVPVRNQAERDALTAFPGLEVYRLDNGQVQLCTAAGPPAVWKTTYDPAAPFGQLPSIRVFRANSAGYNSPSIWYPVPWDGYDTFTSYDPGYAGTPQIGGGEYFGHDFSATDDRRILIKKSGLYFVEHESAGNTAPAGVRVNYMTDVRTIGTTITGSSTQTSTVARISAGSYIGGSIVQPSSDVADGTNGFRNHLVITRLGD